MQRDYTLNETNLFERSFSMKKSTMLLSLLSLSFLVACGNKAEQLPVHQPGIESDLATDSQEVSTDKVDSQPAIDSSDMNTSEESIEETTPNLVEEESQPSTNPEDDSVGQDDKVIPEFPLEMETPKTDGKDE